ncbi:MAG: PAS domain S-box protein [Candidatus Paceibacterota bacterium]|jgi:PAS domain S-box-containing protein
MLKIKTKLFLFFLTNAVFLCISTGFAIIYIEKLGSSIENMSSLGKAVDDIITHSEDFSKVAYSYSTLSPDKYDSLRSEMTFSASHFDHAIEVMQNDPNLHDYISSIKKIKDQYLDLAQKISLNRKSRYEQNLAHSATLSDLEETREGRIGEYSKLTADMELLLTQVGYSEKEFNFQFEDKEHSDEWLALIEDLEAASKKEESDEFSGLVATYAGIADRSIIEKNSLIDLDLNYGYYLEKIDNVSLENRVRNAKTKEYIDSMISRVRQSNNVFKLGSIFFIFFLLLFGSIMLAIYSRKTTAPILSLIDVSKKILGGDLSVRARIRSNDEMGYLSDTFDKMLDSIDEKNVRLKKESLQLKTLLSSISEGLLLIDEKYNILLANTAASLITRTASKDLQGKNLKETLEILHNMDMVPSDKWPFEHVFKTGRSISLKLNDEYYFKTREGRIFPVEIMIAPIESGNSTGAIVVFKDITEMKLIEEEREFSRKNLESVLKSIYIERDNVQEEKDKLEALLNSMGDAVLAIDEEKKVIAFNPVAEKITGLGVDEFEGETFSKKIKFIEEETQKTKEDFIDKVLLKGEKVELDDLAILNKKGKMVLVDINAAPIKNYKGVIIGCIIIFKDVTFKREAERMRTDFISIVSHQLRTPLSAMKWFLEILLDGDVGALKKEQKDVVSEIHESNKNMINFVNQMLNVSRIESRRLAINIEKIKLCKTISELLKEIKPFFTEKKQKISYNCIADKDLEINTDKNLLRNVLSSVLLNASRYTPQKGIIELQVSRYNKDFVLFKIKDNGIGIPEDEQVKIFRKFARASNAIRYEANGTGLGLYIVKSIINMVCGKIWFESVENKGTTFYFTIPIENMVCEIDENDKKMLI